MLWYNVVWICSMNLYGNDIPIIILWESISLFFSARRLKLPSFCWNWIWRMHVLLFAFLLSPAQLNTNILYQRNEQKWISYKMTLVGNKGPNSQRLTISKSMVYSNPLTKISVSCSCRSHYRTSVIVRVGSRLFCAYFSQRIWINHGFESSQPLRIRADMFNSCFDIGLQLFSRRGSCFIKREIHFNLK